MGRVYAVKADESKGEIPATSSRLWLLFGDWVRCPLATRVEFDEDADTGMATVTIIGSLNGNILTGPDNAHAEFRCRHFARFKFVTSEDPNPSPELTPEEWVNHGRDANGKWMLSQRWDSSGEMIPSATDCTTKQR